MDFSITEAMFKLMFLCLFQGIYGVTIHHLESETVLKGQNLSLPCIIDELDIKENKINIIQMEWIKQQQGTDQKIGVFHPDFPIRYFKNASIISGVYSEAGKLKGSVLHMPNVTVSDSGSYICEITSYPHGSIRKITKVKVTEPPVSMKMLYPHGFVKEGDDVKMTCSASPPPQRYKLRRLKDESFSLESSLGEFIISNVTRNHSDLYVCFPEMDSMVQHQRGLNSTVELTVNFLDNIECNTSSPLKVTVGEDVTISCKTKASQPLLFKWMKGNTTLSYSDILSLSSVTSDQAGTYKLTAAFYNNQLWTDTEFFIHVLSEMSKGFTTEMSSSPVRSFSTLSPIQSTEPVSNFTFVETSSEQTTVTTSESSHYLTSTAQPNATVITTYESLLNESSSASPAGNASTFHPHFVNQTSSLNGLNLSTTAVSKTGSNLVTFAVTSKSIITSTLNGDTVIIEKDSIRASYIVIPILLLLLILIALLYRRHLTKKRMDMPPPFKPPPPPVKYTSVRNNDVPMTGIQV